jgi:hypothetical protein
MVPHAWKPEFHLQTLEIYTNFRYSVISQPHPGGIKGSPTLWKSEFHLQTFEFQIPTKKFILFLDVWWFNNPALVKLRGPPCLGIRIPPSNPRILNTHRQIFIQIEFILILDVWWFQNPVPVELNGPPCLEARIPPSNPQILNTHKQIFIQIEFILILDVWWFHNPTPVELRGPPRFGNPNSTFKLSN